MAAPIAGGVNQVAQVAQQQTQKPEAAPKTGASKFDQTMANKADAASATKQTSQVQATQQAQAVQKAGHIDQVQKAGKVDETLKSRSVKANDPVSQKNASQKVGGEKPSQAIEQMLTDMEGRNANMDKFINQAMTGKLKLNQQQLLGLQAKVSQYSLELDLTGKVVEKATNGIKDTLKTQV
jgi:hypothetical protein